MLMILKNVVCSKVTPKTYVKSDGSEGSVLFVTFKDNRDFIVCKAYESSFLPAVGSLCDVRLNYTCSKKGETFYTNYTISAVRVLDSSIGWD